MSAFECWQGQRDALRLKLKEQSSLADVAYCLRHAILQTEQNTLSELDDDELRQQAGVLFSCIKTSVGLVELNIATTAWTPAPSTDKQRRRGSVTLWSAAGVMQALLAAIGYLKSQWLVFGLALAALLAGGAALIAFKRKPRAAAANEVRVTLKPDEDRLIGLMDAQFRAVDRYINDLAYLNEQLRGDAGGADNRTLGYIADMLEALYELDGDARTPAEDALKQLMESMSLRAVDYSSESRGFFTSLPSKTETRTLAPAIVSTKDYRLLRRGTAAVKMEVA